MGGCFRREDNPFLNLTHALGNEVLELRVGTFFFAVVHVPH